MSTTNLLRTLSLLLAGITIFVSMADQAGAWGRRRGRYYYNDTTATTPTDGATTYPAVTFSKQVAPKIDPASRDYRSLEVSYHYDLAMSEDEVFQDRLRVFLFIDDKEVLESAETVIAEVKITDTSNYQTEHIRFVPVMVDETPTEDGKRSAYFDVVNQEGQEPIVAPSKVYRLFVNLHRESDTQSADTAIGRIPLPCYLATSGDTRLERARQQIVMRTFKEFYYRKNGWRTGESYSMDCYAYYMWATGFCTVGAENGRTRLHKLFGSEDPYNIGSQIPELVKERPIHGDYVRQPGHSFMLLSYDEQRNQVWTMEGNFNSTIEVVIRTVGPSWQVGHLRDRHIQPGLFNRAWQRLSGRG